MIVKVQQQVIPRFVIRGKSLSQGDALSPLMYSLAVAMLIYRIDKYLTSIPQRQLAIFISAVLLGRCNNIHNVTFRNTNDSTRNNRV